MAVKVEFGIKPYPLQQEILDTLDGRLTNSRNTPYRFCVAILGRQSGKSWLAKYAALDRAINRNQYVMWVGPAISSARGHWNDITQLIERSKLPVKKISQAEKTIYFLGGGVLTVRSAIEPDNLRGPSLDFLILDEAAVFRDGAYVWYQVCLPMITATRGTVLFTTTPNGMNWVYDLYKRGQDKKDNYYKSWRVPSWESPYQDVHLLEDLKSTMPSKAYREEFGAEFLADGGGVFAGVRRAAVVESIAAPLPLHEYVAGIDIGFNNDKTCFTVIDKHTRQQVFGVQMSHVGTLETVSAILRLLEHWQPVVTHVEKNGLGEHLLGLLKEVAAGRGEADLTEFIQQQTEGSESDWGGVVSGHTIRGVHIDNTMKRNLVERLAADIEYGRFEILADTEPYGETQMREMSTFERKRTKGGLQTTYSAAIGSHDDTIAALYMAYRGVPKAYTSYADIKAGSPKEDGQRSPFRGRGKVRTYAKRD